MGDWALVLRVTWSVGLYRTAYEDGRWMALLKVDENLFIQVISLHKCSEGVVAVKGSS